jgi:hypothetical protein
MIKAFEAQNIERDLSPEFGSHEMNFRKGILTEKKPDKLTKRLMRGLLVNNRQLLKTNSDTDCGQNE